MACGRPIKLFSAELTTTEETQYTVPVGKYVIITQITYSVKDSGYLSIWLVPNGGASADDNNILPDVNFDSPSHTVETGLGYVLETGDFIRTQSEKNDAVTVRMDGIEVDA